VDMAWLATHSIAGCSFCSASHSESECCREARIERICCYCWGTMWALGLQILLNAMQRAGLFQKVNRHLACVSKQSGPTLCSCPQQWHNLKMLIAATNFNKLLKLHAAPLTHSPWRCASAPP
jgi:hypothetical protein